MAPIHHHFEKLGWHETTITARFVALGVVGALVGSLAVVAGGLAVAEPASTAALGLGQTSSIEAGG